MAPKSKTKKFTAEKSHYEVLDVSATATTLDIQRSFERLCEDKVDIENVDSELRKKSAETLFMLTKSYEILTDPFERLSYDERLFPDNPPLNHNVETIFREGLRAFKNKEVENALRFYKECVYLLPHKPLYRVHLAIVYFEKGWKEYAEKELRVALKLDPKNEFAQEIVAKLLFNVSDKKKSHFFASKLNIELTLLGVTFTSIFLITYFGGDKIKMLLANIFSHKKNEFTQEKAMALRNSLPEDMRRAIEKNVTKSIKAQETINVQDFSIKKLPNDYKPEGQIYDYKTQKAVKKTYYPEQSMVMIEYENGNILSYKFKDVVGWKIDPEIKKPVIITQGNEVIPLSSDLPVNVSDGKILNPDDPNFPYNLFPEYERKEPAKTKNNDQSSGNSNLSENEVNKSQDDLTKKTDSQIQIPVNNPPKIMIPNNGLPNNGLPPAPPRH